jgi:hypothetical protein
MNEFVRFLKVFGLIIGIFLVGAAIGWFGTRGSRTAEPPGSPVAGTSAEPQAPGPLGTKPTFLADNYRSLTSESIQPPVTGMVATVNLITNWEDRLDEILSGKQDEDAKAREMLGIFYQLPADGQEEVAQHLSNLVSDEQYPAFGQNLTNSALPEEVLDVLLSDALNRPNKLKLPLLIDVARDPSNPKATEAKDLLELYLEEDYGTNWTTWRQKVDLWLKDNPD